MAWVKIDDQFYDHPKWADAPGDSIALWLAAMAWCNRNESFDGYIPAVKCGGLVAVRSVKRTCDDLVNRRGFVPHQAGFIIHGYAEWQQNEKVKAIREKRSAAGRAGAAARWGEIANGMANAKQMPWQTDGNENAPPPTTHFVTGRDNSTPENTRQGVDISRINDIVETYATIETTRARNEGRIKASESGYRKSALRTAREHPELHHLAEHFPDAPASAVAAWLLGDKGSQQYYKTAEELAAAQEGSEWAEVVVLGGARKGATG